MHANKYFIESVKCAAEALEDQATSLSKEPEFVLQNTVGTAVREAHESMLQRAAILKDWCILANKERGE
jgi:hypothetical protein